MTNEQAKARLEAAGIEYDAEHQISAIRTAGSDYDELQMLFDLHRLPHLTGLELLLLGEIMQRSLVNIYSQRTQNGQETI